MRLIDADELKSKLKNLPQWGGEILLISALTAVDKQPTADAVEVVRCKDCVKKNTPECAMWYDCMRCGGQWSWETDNGYCSYGERREE